jgi:nucleoside-diphosphate-sugar epimerase
VPRVVARARAGRLAIVGRGTNRVSLTFVENAAAAHVQAAEALLRGGPAGRAFFVNDAEPVQLWPWINALLARLGMPQVTRRIPLPVARAAGAVAEAVWSTLGLRGEPPMTRFVAAQLGATHTYSLRPAREAFGYAPPVSGADGFERTLEWFRTRLSRAEVL